MTTDRRRIVLWAILVFSILFTTYTWWSRMAGEATAPAAPAAGAAAPAEAAAGASAAPSTAAPVPEAPPLPEAELAEWRSQFAGALRDPFFTVAELEAMSRPAAGPGPVLAPSLPAYTVKLVMVAGADRHALVDRQVVKVGDMIGSERVAEIVSDAVVLERDGRRRTLQVASGGSSGVQIRRERTP